MTPQENQPGEAAQDLDRSEPQAECHTPHNVSEGVKRLGLATRQLDDITTIICGVEEQSTGRYVLASDYAAERAKRLELEVELAKAKRDHEHEERLHCSTIAQRDNFHEWADKLAACAGGIEVIGEHSNLNCPWENALEILEDFADFRIRAENSEAELLALRGGKVGQTDLVGTEAKADGESRPTSALETREMFLWREPFEGGTTLYKFYDLCECADDCEKATGWSRVRLTIRTLSGGSKSESVAPSPEPAAIPKTTKVREWWIVVHKHGGSTSFDTEQSARFYLTNVEEVVHVREVTGEGRKVSANWLAIAWLKVIARGETLEGPEASEFARELLCVLSEEGGRQKEGQGDAAGRLVDGASDLNPQNKSDL